MRLIDADNANIQDIDCSYACTTDLWSVEDWLNNQPTIDAAPIVHGRWLDGFCTNCACEAPDFITYVGCELYEWEPTPYCPNCGAKMDGDIND